MERQQTVLIADDEAQIREILSLYFKKEGFKVIEAADGAEALVQIQAGKPDIILLDIMMPVLDGFEVCKQVRKISDVPIIMLTAKDFDDDRILGLEIRRWCLVAAPCHCPASRPPSWTKWATTYPMARAVSWSSRSPGLA